MKTLIFKNIIVNKKPYYMIWVIYRNVKLLFVVTLNDIYTLVMQSFIKGQSLDH